MTGPVRAVWSDASDGDLRPSGPTGGGGENLTRWVARVTTTTTTTSRPLGTGRVSRVHWLTQVHGAPVVTVAPWVRAAPRAGAAASGGAADAVEPVWGGPGDAVVSEDGGGALAILTADCASLALGSPEGIFGAVHAGWRGLTAGVVEAAVGTMRAMGAGEVVGALGPCIHPECYEFSEADLAAVVAAYGPRVRGRTVDGRPALDIPATVSAALVAAGARETNGVSACTACGKGHFSHRGRGDRARQALAVWSAGGS